MRLTLNRFWRRPRATSTAAQGQDSAEDQAIQVGLQIRQRRDDLGISLRELALQTRITTPVLEALERGWRDRLPERTYLSAMVTRLEQALSVPAGSLAAVLPAPADNPLIAQKRHGLRRFTPGSIDVVTTWQGSLLYGIVIAVSLVAVNRQQRALIEQNSLNLEPVRAALTPAASSAEQRTPTTLLRGLRPLENLSDQPPERWLSALRQADASRPGVLEMTLSQASAVTVRSGSGDRLQLQATQGSITLSLKQPLTISISPAPQANDQVLWNGAVLLPDDGRPGTYSMPRTAEAPASDRPQTAPLSP